VLAGLDARPADLRVGDVGGPDVRGKSGADVPLRTATTPARRGRPGLLPATAAPPGPRGRARAATATAASPGTQPARAHPRRRQPAPRRPRPQGAGLSQARVPPARDDPAQPGRLHAQRRRENVVLGGVMLTAQDQPANFAARQPRPPGVGPTRRLPLLNDHPLTTPRHGMPAKCPHPPQGEGRAHRGTAHAPYGRERRITNSLRNARE
jgi:hypothetical protein